jgi:hypothetical protein
LIVYWNAAQLLDFLNTSYRRGAFWKSWRTWPRLNHLTLLCIRFQKQCRAMCSRRYISARGNVTSTVTVSVCCSNVSGMFPSYNVCWWRGQWKGTAVFGNNVNVLHFNQLYILSEGTSALLEAFQRFIIRKPGTLKHETSIHCSKQYLTFCLWQNTTQPKVHFLSTNTDNTSHINVTWTRVLFYFHKCSRVDFIWYLCYIYIYIYIYIVIQYEGKSYVTM